MFPTIRAIDTNRNLALCPDGNMSVAHGADVSTHFLRSIEESAYKTTKNANISVMKSA